MMIKKFILALIVLIEITIGSIFLIKYYFSVKNIKVVEVQKENLILGSQDYKFKYYYELKPNITVNDKPPWLKHQVTYTYNSDGLNDRYSYDLKKTDDVFRIITLGDSFTYGLFVNTKDNWTEVLEDMLNEKYKNICENKKFEVINLGMPGYDVPYIVERYKNYGKKYDPNMVIWLESGEGYFRNRELMHSYLEECQNGNKYSEEYKKNNDICWSEAQEMVEKQEGLNKLANDINLHFRNFFELANPEKTIFFGFKNALITEERETAIKLRLETYNFMDFRPIISDIFQQKGTLLDGHPNEVGHKIIAETILESIKNDLTRLGLNCELKN